jgi:hypothetical protein
MQEREKGGEGERGNTTLVMRSSKLVELESTGMNMCL